MATGASTSVRSVQPTVVSLLRMPLPTAPRIWIVDDDEDDQFLFEEAFKQLIPPVAVKLLSDGEELLPALSNSETLPDLILLDLNMPRLNGFEAIKWLRSQRSYQTLPIVVLSTSSSLEDQEKALRRKWLSDQTPYV